MSNFKVSFLLLCVLGMSGCGQERSINDLKTEIATREAAAAQKAAIAEARARNTYTFKNERGYTYEVMKVCIDGIQYYYGDVGHGGIFAPVVRVDTLAFTRCDKP